MTEEPKETKPKAVPPAVRKANDKAHAASQKKKQDEMVAEFMTSGIDFSPFTIDPGDGREWAFSPDPMPSDTERLRKCMKEVEATNKSGDGVSEAFEGLTEAIRSRLISDDDKAEFPLPYYGTNALMFFALHLATGRDGFPKEGA